MIYLFDILFIVAMGGLNSSYLNSGKYLKNIKSAFSVSDRERKNTAMPVIKFKF